MNDIDAGAVIINMTSIILTGIIAFTVMWRMNKANEKMQSQKEKSTLCDSLEVLVAEYCTVLHKLYRSSDNYRISEWGSDLSANVKYGGEIELTSDDLGLIGDEIEIIKDEVDSKFFVIEMKLKDRDEFNHILERLKQLKEVKDYLVSGDLQNFKGITLEARNELSDQIKKYKSTV